MVPDSKECNENAHRCIEMANRSQDTKLQSTLFEMAKAWMQVAAELQRIEAKGSGQTD
jgi:hypothetical protein